MFLMYIFIYNFFMYIIQPGIWIRLFWRNRKEKYFNYLSWLERYGICNCSIKPNGIVLHAVSLGEIISAVPLINFLKKNYPNKMITFTTMTITGLQFIKSNFGDYASCRFLPYDLFGSMKRFLDQVQPKLVIIMETELWPNFIYILNKRNIPCIIANARLSSQSFSRYKKISHFMGLVIQRVSLIAAQNHESAVRFIKLGCNQNKLFVMGNLKFDIELTCNLLKKIFSFKKKWIKQRLTWIASSTHAGEEFFLLYAHKRLLGIFPDLLMIIVPRHLDRVVKICNFAEKIGLSYVIKSNGIKFFQETQVIINDTTGELMLLYGISDIVFVGGSLIKHGGHNPLEPAVLALPIITGPYFFNFQDIYEKLYQSGGLVIITDVNMLIHAIFKLLTDHVLRLRYGNNAMQVLYHNRGALNRLLFLLDVYL